MYAHTVSVENNGTIIMCAKMAECTPSKKVIYGQLAQGLVGAIFYALDNCSITFDWVQSFC